uniref:Vesicle-fusing ATPase n=1 Tax=Dermatophagoides pteronyssinus TaxID=6956 RepID=A0A6P6YDP8_DERPT|nr:vesicular-fusion protein sec18-like [Dermatophagoides pteronyssinus]
MLNGKITFFLESTPDVESALYNCALVNPKAFEKLKKVAHSQLELEKNRFVVRVEQVILVLMVNASVQDETIICIPAVLRSKLNKSTGSIVQVELVDSSSKFDQANEICITLDRWSPNQKNLLTLDKETLISTIKTKVLANIVQKNQILALGYDQITLPGTVTELFASKRNLERAIINSTTKISLQTKNNKIFLSGEDALFNTTFNFDQLGIGGLQKEYEEIFRRAFISRTVSAQLMNEIGIDPVRGLLLYGLPGTGKTLIARKIGQALNVKNIKVINGPEILNKYVGESEKNIRELFCEAESDYKKYGLKSPLHIIIFDEIDAICKQRGSSSASTGVNDSVVNQLLSKIDGVEQLNNILLIGITNRYDMLDDALLRPGRFEVHVPIKLPDTNGRYEILMIHTSTMRKNNRLDASVDLKMIAETTVNYTGAELAGLVRSAASYALRRSANMDNTTNTNPKVDEKNVKLTFLDFELALNEVTPAFGVPHEQIKQYLKYDFIMYSNEYVEVLNNLETMVLNLCHKTGILSVLLHGLPGNGKTSFAIWLALKVQFPFLRVIRNTDYIGSSQNMKILQISEIFSEAYNSEKSVIVLDDIEQIVEYSPLGPVYSNTILQGLTGLITTPPPKNHSLLIIATTSRVNCLQELWMTDSFTTDVRTKGISDYSELVKTIESYFTKNQFRLEEIKQIADICFENYKCREIPIKKLFYALEMVLAEKKKKSGDTSSYSTLHKNAYVNCLKAFNII